MQWALLKFTDLLMALDRLMVKLSSYGGNWWWRLPLWSSHDEGYCHTSKEEKHPNIKTVDLFSTCMHAYYMCQGDGVHKSTGLGKIYIPLDQFINNIVLSWIKMPPREFRHFVPARVAKIQETIGWDQICYIKSNNNPAMIGIILIISWSSQKDHPSWSCWRESGPAFKTTPKLILMWMTLKLYKRRKCFRKKRKPVNIILPLQKYVLN